MTPEEAQKVQDARLSAGYDWCPDDMHDGLEEDMLATIAAQTWEYGVEVRPDEDSEWQNTGPWWDTVEKARAYRGHAILRLGTPYSHDRVIRRLVGPIEPIDKEVP